LLTGRKKMKTGLALLLLSLFVSAQSSGGDLRIEEVVFASNGAMRLDQLQTSVAD
jgi:hypothetical protein